MHLVTEEIPGAGAVLREIMRSLTVTEALAALRLHDDWDKIAAAVVTAAINRGDVVTSDDHVEAIEKEQAKTEAIRERFTDFAAGLDHLQAMIAEGRRDDALRLLRDLAPGHQFLSDAAAIMLAGLHQPGLPL